jgi:hypothetical protein
LNNPGGVGNQKIRPDFQNQHTWIEIYHWRSHCTMTRPGSPQDASEAHEQPQRHDDELSGTQWVPRFPTSRSVTDLVEPFRTDVERFISALRNAGAGVEISATLRPRERAYLMHYAYAIAREHLDPAHVPPSPGVNIRWLHTNPQGQPDLNASRVAAEQMVQSYGIVHRPALESQHVRGLAIDMNIYWLNNLVIVNGAGRRITITGTPRNGAGNSDLHDVGASYGVYKLRSDPPHWSSDGH